MVSLVEYVLPFEAVFVELLTTVQFLMGRGGPEFIIVVVFMDVTYFHDGHKSGRLGERREGDSRRGDEREG